MKQFRSEAGGVRLLALALVAVVGLGAYAVIYRGHESHVAVAKAPRKSVLSSYAPAAKVVAHAVPAAPKPEAPVTVAPAATETRHPTRALRQQPASVRPASEAPAQPAPTPEPPPGPTEGTRVSTGAPDPPPEPLAISDVRIDALSPSTAQITFHTNLPATARASYGIDAPTVWTAAEPTGALEHQTVLSGLSFSTSYQVWLHAVDD